MTRQTGRKGARMTTWPVASRKSIGDICTKIGEGEGCGQVSLTMVSAQEDTEVDPTEHQGT